MIADVSTAIDAPSPAATRRQMGLTTRGILLGALAVTLAVVVRIAFSRWIGEESFRLFFAAVVVAAWYGGLIPGLITMALATLAGTFFFLPPQYGFALDNQVHITRTVLFVLEGTVTCMLCASLHRAWRKLTESEAETRQLERQLLSVSEAEQRRIGHDLHDGLGQQLTGLALIGKTLAQRLRNKNLSEADDAARIADLANGAIRHTRELARGLAPLNADAMSLPDALQRLAETVGDMARSTIVLRLESHPQNLPPEAAMHMFRITQEALTNAMRHAQASRIEITLDHDGTATLLNIADNGKGLGKSPKLTGMGLRLMRYRAKIIGGTLNVLQRSSGGTVVSCRVPDPVTAVQ